MSQSPLKPIEAIRVGAVGHGCVDLAVGWEGEPPGPNELRVAQSARIALGGPAQAAIITAKRLGVGRAVYCGAAGADDLGEVQRFLLQQQGIDTSGVVKHGEGSATAVLVRTGRPRSFVHFPGVNAVFDDAMLDYSRFEGLDGVHLAGCGLMTALDGKPAARMLAKLKQMGLRTSVDLVNTGAAEPRSAWPILEPMLPHVDCLSISMNEARQFTGLADPAKVAAFLKPLVNGAVLVKMGEDGMLVASPAHHGLLGVHAVPVVVKDDTGAGDAAAMAVFVRLLQGHSLPDAARFACATGAWVVREGRGVNGVPTAAEIDSLVAAHYPKPG